MKKLVMICAMGLLISACGAPAEEQEAINQDYISIPKTLFESSGMKEVEMVEKKEAVYVQCTGFIDAPPHNRASISNYMGGYVVNNPLLVGDQVKNGDFLLRLENPDFIHLQEDYLALRAELEYSSKAFDRQSSLYKDSISSGANYQAAKSEFEVKKARMSALEQKLKLLGVNAQQLEAENISSSIEIKAPIDGVISKVNTQLGSYVSPQAVMLEIIDGSHLHLELEVYEKDINQLKVGQTIKFSVSDVNAEELEGEVHLIGNTVDAEKRTVKVHGHLPDSVSGRLQVGMFVKAYIKVKEERMYTYPEGTVVKNEGHWKGLRLVEAKENEMICEVMILGDAEENAAAYSSKEKDSQHLIQGGYHYMGEGDAHDH